MIRNLLAGFLLFASAATAQMTSPATASATVGTPFSYQIEPSNPASISFVISGLPPGLSGNSAYGTISGTPTAAGTFPVTVGITSAGTFKESPLTLTVNPAGTAVPPTTPPAPPAAPTCATKPCIVLSCTPSPQANSTSTVTMMRGVGTAAPAQLAAGLPNNCAYADTAVSAGNTYTYSAVAVVNGQQSGDSNSFTVTIPAVTLTTPTVSIAFSPATADAATAVTVTVSVNATGTVTLSSGAYNSAAATVTNGVATIQIPGGTLDVGSISITATYTPDAAGASLYNPATSVGLIVITPTSPTALSGATG